MRFRTSQFAVLIAACLFGATVLRAEDKPMAPPKPAPEMSQLAYFAGTWGCKGKVFTTPMGPEHATEGTVHATLDLGGFWVFVRYEERKTAANPMPYRAGMFMGYDATEKVFVLRCHDSFGAYCAETGKGWSGDTFVLEGQNMGMGPRTNIRETFVKKGPREMVHSSEMQGPDGKWMKVDEETCRNAGVKG